MLPHLNYLGGREGGSMASQGGREAGKWGGGQQGGMEGERAMSAI